MLRSDRLPLHLAREMIGELEVIRLTAGSLEAGEQVKAQISISSAPKAKCKIPRARRSLPMGFRIGLDSVLAGGAAPLRPISRLRI